MTQPQKVQNKKAAPNPDHELKCLLVYPKFSPNSFWNYKPACELINAKAPAPPLGLITIASILPSQWEYKLIDLNTQEFDQELWDWADIICTGGMLPQQQESLKVVERAVKDSKFVAVGGPDPSSQPDIYSMADVVCAGEGEEVIPIWLKSWRSGEPRGIFREVNKVDVTTSPLPRYDLINIADYTQINIQYSRGCPFNCEFCDIIELYGRKPRGKTPEQFTKELDAIRATGWSGHIDIVDDNFIGNIRKIKRELLPSLAEWNKKNRYPFYYSTEASMNMADDVKLLEMMQEAEFRLVFMGIETPDPELLLKTQKSQNTVRPIVERVQKCYEYGITVAAGFIMGFDGEKKGMDKSMIKLIEDCQVCIAMVGLLVALPNTQLTRRLIKEKRLTDFNGNLVNEKSKNAAGLFDTKTTIDVSDQTTSGLNFITTRPREDIIQEYSNVINNIFDPINYFNRAEAFRKSFKIKSRYKPRMFAIKRNLLGLWRLIKHYRKIPALKWRFYRIFLLTLVTKGPIAVEQVLRLLSLYIHYSSQLGHIEQAMIKLKNQKSTDKVVSNLPAHTLNEISKKQTKKTAAHI